MKLRCFRHRRHLKNQVDNAIAIHKVDPYEFNIAVVGFVGGGKSTFVNSIRGLRATDEGAAKVNVDQVIDPRGYPDPTHGFVWYDIPGAGTIKVPEKNYFNNQGLIAFDFVIVLYDFIFGDIDIDILRECAKRQIPAAIVRSKTDIQVADLMADEGLSLEEAKAVFKERSHEIVNRILEHVGLGVPELFCVSRENLRNTVLASDGAVSGTNCNEEFRLLQYLKLMHLQNSALVG